MEESAGAVPENREERSEVSEVERDNGESSTSGNISIYRRLRQLLEALIIALIKLLSFRLKRESAFAERLLFRRNVRLCVSHD